MNPGSLKNDEDKQIDWVKVLQRRARYSDVIQSDELLLELNITASTLRKALGRLQNRGLVQRVTHKIYLNLLALDYSPKDLVNVLRPDSYVSLDSALRFWGISTQVPAAVTCVTTSRPREYGSGSNRIVYRSISEKLFWGATEHRTRYAHYKMAEPEKALLDWTYLSLQDGIQPSLDEFELTALSRSKLVKYVEKFPASVAQTLMPYLASQTLAA